MNLSVINVNIIITGTAEELRFIGSVADATGVVLDPVYSGKALFSFVKVAASRPDM